MLPNNGRGFEDFTAYTTSAMVTPSKEVFRFGRGPAIIVLHELFGAGPTLFQFAHRLAVAGFEVYVPILFGKANHAEAPAYNVLQVMRVCLSREFASFSSGRSSPIADWVRLLGLEITQRTQQTHLGVVGLCLTGNFALTLACDDWVAASVVSEPALPFSMTSNGKKDLHLSPFEVALLKQRVANGFQILAFRFDGDGISPAERDANLRAVFSPGVLGSGCLKPTRRGAHAVFTGDFDETPMSSTATALDELIAYLRRRLQVDQ
jgi:dienelactone hydrolase